jgi:hypothetical protein
MLSLIMIGHGMALNSAMRVCARVQIPVCPEPPLVFWHELLGGLRTGFLVVSPLRIACVFLHMSEAEALSEYGMHNFRSIRIKDVVYS